MRKTLTAGTALIAAAAHPRRATYAVTSTTSAGPTPHTPAFDRPPARARVQRVGEHRHRPRDRRWPDRYLRRRNDPRTVVIDDASRRGFVTDKGAVSVSVIDLAAGITTSSRSAPIPTASPSTSNTAACT